VTDAVAVLVVEDEAIILWDIIDRLETDGFKTYRANNADAALALLDKHLDIGLLFIDINIPGSMNGLTLAAAASERWPQVNIIVTSGKHLAKDVSIPDGAMFFDKPYDHAKFSRAMREMLRL